MELWAAGFNAWGQLEFREADGGTRAVPLTPSHEPGDLFKFERVLTGKDICRPRANLASIIGKPRVTSFTEPAMPDKDIVTMRLLGLVN